MAKTADDVLAVARSYLGVTETHNNNVIFNTWYYGHTVSGPQYPWCVTFLWAVFTLADCGNLFYGGNRTAYAPALMQWFQKQGRFDRNPRKGDIAFFSFDGNSTPGHVGIVESAQNGYVTTIDGNTSAGNQADGGKVARRSRPLSQTVGFGHPAYADAAFIPYAVRVTASDFLNIRTGPGTENPILRIDRDGIQTECFLLPGMETVIHAESSNGWGRLANINGWVSLKYCKKL